MNEEWQIDYIGGKPTTNIVSGTTAERAFKLWLAKRQQIADLEYESKVLVDKYHEEMCHASIPSQFREDVIDDMFGKDEKKSEFARGFFLKQCFTEEFLGKHTIEFNRVVWHGYGRTAAGVVLGIGDYEYTIEVPMPHNIVKDEDKDRLVGMVRFRADRLHKSKKDEFVKTMEAVQMPTYDWKACFKAIEAVVEKGE